MLFFQLMPASEILRHRLRCVTLPNDYPLWPCWTHIHINEEKRLPLLLLFRDWLKFIDCLFFLPKVEILDLVELLEEALWSFHEATSALFRGVWKANLILIFLICYYVFVFAFWLFRCLMVGLHLHHELVAGSIQLLLLALRWALRAVRDGHWDWRRLELCRWVKHACFHFYILTCFCTLFIAILPVIVTPNLVTKRRFTIYFGWLGHSCDQTWPKRALLRFHDFNRPLSPLEILLFLVDRLHTLLIEIYALGAGWFALEYGLGLGCPSTLKTLGSVSTADRLLFQPFQT